MNERRLCQRCEPEGYCISAASAKNPSPCNYHFTGDPLKVLQNGNRIARDQQLIDQNSKSF